MERMVANAPALAYITSLEDMLLRIVCRKGCGDVRVVKNNGEPVCSSCGEEVFHQVSNAQYFFLMKHAPEILEEEQ